MEAGGPEEGDPEPPQGFGGQTRKDEPYGYHKAPGMCRQFDGKAAKA
jgi:hypothetical protein